jgi:hypothetical protein
LHFLVVSMRYRFIGATLCIGMTCPVGALSPALPFDRVTACLHLKHDEIQIAKESAPVLDSFREYLRPRISGVFAMQVHLSREYTAEHSESQFLLFADHPNYQSFAVTEPSETTGLVHTSETRVYRTVTPTQRQFIGALLSADLAQIEDLGLTETRTSDQPPPCEVELTAQLRSLENRNEFRTIECTKDGCAVTIPRPTAK